jgi:hypothetical protein
MVTGALTIFAGLRLVFETARARKWRASDIDALAAQLRARGIGYGDLSRHARGPDASLLALHVAAIEPFELFARPSGDEPLLLFALPSEAAQGAPHGLALLPLGAGRVALWGRLPGRVRSDAFELCIPDEHGERCASGALDPEAVVRQAGARAVAWRVPSAIEQVLGTALGSLRQGATLRYRLAIDASRASDRDAHVVRFAPGTRLVAVSGGSGHIRAAEWLELEPGDSGTLELEAPFDRERHGFSPPNFAEVSASYRTWLEGIPW